jgi:CRISPR system Cascade subunit CasE
MNAFITAVPLHELLSHLPKNTSFRALQNPDILHSSVMRLFGPLPHFGDGGARASAGVLFRIEPIVQGVAPFALIRSKFAPVVRTASMRTGVDLPAPDAGTHVSFRIALNAVRRKARPPGTTASCGITSVPEEQLADYLAERLGPALTDVTVLNSMRTVIGLKANGRAPVQIDLLDGVAVVENPNELEGALLRGIGRAKNFGCGLLTVRPR